MGISFFETMRGQLTDENGQTHPARFEIKAEATHMRRFLVDGTARITGVVDAEPWAEDAALEGEIRIRPFLAREVAYAFDFSDANGNDYRLAGKKSINWLNPVESWTQLEVGLEDADGEVARGTLEFDIAELLSFLATWWPSTSLSSVELQPPAPQDAPPRALSDGEREVLGALIEASFVEGANVPAGDAITTEETERRLEQMPGHITSLYRLGLKWLDSVSLFRRGSRLAELDLDARRGLLEELTNPEQTNPLVKWMQPHLVIQLLTTLPKSVHFGRRDYLDAIGHPPPREVEAEKPPRYLRKVIEPEELGPETELRAHVVVVGTGAGGAAVANALAKKGLAVAIVEEGRYRHRHDFTGEPMERIHDMYRYQAVNFTLGTPIVIPQGRVVGGTTTVNSGTCFTTPDHVLDEWREDLGFPDDFRPDHYHQYSERVSRMLQVEPGTDEAVGKIAHVIARGADAMGYEHGPLPRNAPGCPGVGECILGCPEGAKRSTDVSYIPAALEAGAELYCGLPVTRVLMNGSKAVAVEARGTDNHGAAKTLRIRADHIVLACGSLLSPLLLEDNGIRNRWIGKNLSVHPGMGVFARTNQDLEPWNAIPQGYGIEALQDEGVRFEGYYLPPPIMSPMTPWVGDELTRWMDDFRQLGQFGFMIRDRGDGWVRRGPGGRPLMGYMLSEQSIEKLKKGSALLTELFFEAGASEVFVGAGPIQTVDDKAGAQAIRDADLGPLDFRLLGAHPLGTCRMAASADAGVVDFDYRVFGTDNLHVVDGSVVPTSLGVNPQMTIMAMALRAGDVIAEKIGA